jgi:serine/threonine-protein kinase
MEFVGRTLGHYHIAAQIGEGGMGVVYRARDLTLERDVAVKVLPTGTLADESERKRFRKEALALAKLNHTNIEAVFEFGEQDGIDFLVMEYVPGEPLSEKLRGGALREKEICTLGEQVAAALAEAHEQGVVHRDLKPGNIQVTPKGQVKVLDFGLAKLLRPAGDAELTASVTEAMVVAGTLPYMAPEQLLGEAVDGRADLFALGAVLYEMATGQRAFPHTQGPRLIDAILHLMPPAPRAVNSKVSPALEAIILKCLEKDPNRRYQSARELFVDLERLRAPTSTAVTESPVKARARKLWLASAAAVLVLAAVAAYVYWPRTTLASLAVLPFENRTGNPELEYLSDGVTESVIHRVSLVPKLKVIAYSSVARYKGKEPEPGQVAQELRVEAVLTGRLAAQDDALSVNLELINAEDSTRLWGGHYRKTLNELVNLESEIVRQLLGALHLEFTGEEEKRIAQEPTRNPEALRLYMKGRYEIGQWNKAATERGIALFRQALALDPTYALAWAGLADAYYSISNTYLPPSEAIPLARTAAEKALALDEQLAEAHAALGITKAAYDWDWEGAEREYKRALALNPNSASAHHYYALLLMVRGRFAESRKEFALARELDPLSAIYAAIAVYPLLFSGQYEQALSESEKILAIDPQFCSAHVNAAWALILLGRADEAVKRMESAVKLETCYLNTPAWLAYAYASAGRKAEARAVLKKLEATAKNEYLAIYLLALPYVALGDTEIALRWLERAYEHRVEEMCLLNVDPALRPLRTHPRFQALLKKLNLTK